jgi:hypothetical protein
MDGFTQNTERGTRLIQNPIDAGPRILTEPSLQRRLNAVPVPQFHLAASDLCNEEMYDANLVALPMERTEEFLSLLGQK